MAPGLSLITRLQYLQDLEVLYAEKVRGSANSRWQSLLNFSFDNPRETEYSIIKVRRQFSEKTQGYIIVSTPGLEIVEC